MQYICAAALSGFLMGSIFRSGVGRARQWIGRRLGHGRWADKNFAMLPELAAGKHEICSLALCKILVVDDANFPGWLVLVPQKTGLKEVIDLSKEAQQLLWEEVAMACHALELNFHPHKLNIASLGNVCSQLHIHVTGRDPLDAAWPGPCYGAKPAKPYSPDSLDTLIEALRRAFRAMGAL
eukprot:jgi/Botrbrau1/18306/Bobra.0179s0035.1